MCLEGFYALRRIRIQGLGFGVWAFTVEALGVAWGSGFRVEGFGLGSGRLDSQHRFRFIENLQVVWVSKS